MKSFSFFIKIIVCFLFFSLSAEEKKTSWHQYDSKAHSHKWRLTEEKTVEWVYDLYDNRIEWNDWTGSTRFSYDICNHLNKVSLPNGQETLYQHDPNRNLLKITYPSKEEVGYTYVYI